jgi:hypothetical protein
MLPMLNPRSARIGRQLNRVEAMLIDGDGHTELSPETLHAHNLPLAVEAHRATRIRVFQEQRKNDPRPCGKRKAGLKKHSGCTDVPGDTIAVPQLDRQYHRETLVSASHAEVVFAWHGRVGEFTPYFLRAQ